MTLTPGLLTIKLARLLGHVKLFWLTLPDHQISVPKSMLPTLVTTKLQSLGRYRNFLISSY